jgi:hypothetical protein
MSEKRPPEEVAELLSRVKPAEGPVTKVGASSPVPCTRCGLLPAEHDFGIFCP